jgi:hypothetical protein
VDQYVDNRQKEILWDILANPADNGASYTQSLERLVQDNPQSGILQVLLARAGDKKLLNKAAVYYNPRTLYKLVNHPEGLLKVDTAGIDHTSRDINEHSNYFNADTVIVDEEPAQAVDNIQDEVIITEEADNNIAAAESVEEVKEAPAENIEADSSYIAPATEDEEEVATEEATEEEPTIDEQLQTEEKPIADTPEQNITGETYNRGSRFPKREVPDNIDTTPDTDNTTPEPESPKQDIDDDVYEEIVSIEDIGFEANANEGIETPAEPFTEARFSDPTIETGPEEEEASAVLFHQPEAAAESVQERSRTINEEEDRLILGGIVNTDYLSFDKKLDELRNTTPAESTKVVEPQTAPSADTQEVSRYDDDKMPYTFLWWLNKTRKEHAENLQPYATGKQPKNGAADELQQQYYENIFSLTSVSGVDRDTDPAGIAFDHNKKEDVIIERFIHTEPQIKPLSADKLDNENKAKKSSEDQNDFVTETLARIYTDQMLYHKAIATYKKLILKFPEKQLYFAAQIEQLEKKTN